MKYGFVSFILMGLALSHSASAYSGYVNSSGGIEAHGDFNGDGFVDLVVVDPLLDSMSVFISTSSSTWATPTVYSTGTGSGPEGITAVDLDNDGNLDLVVLNTHANTIAYYRNIGGGHFNLVASYATGKDPKAIIHGDFDNDGYMDIAIINDRASKLAVYMNKPSSPGTLYPPNGYSIGSGSTAGRSLAVADFDNDGYLDIAVTNTGDATVGILLNSGKGSFKAQTTYAVGAMTTTTGAMAVGDLDGDGLPDLVCLNSGESTVSVLRNSGFGGVLLPQVRFDVADGSSVGGIIMADFNHDNKLDVAVTNPGMSSISVILGDGMGGFGKNTDYSTMANPLAIFADDFDLDGNWDLQVIADSSSMARFMGKGDGSF